MVCCLMSRDDAERVLEKSAASADSFSSASQASKYKKAHVSSVFTAGAGGIELGGRTLLVTRAVDRDEATKLKAESDVKKEDRRNLYLAREGCTFGFFRSIRHRIPNQSLNALCCPAVMNHSNSVQQ